MGCETGPYWNGSSQEWLAPQLSGGTLAPSGATALESWWFLTPLQLTPTLNSTDTQDSVCRMPTARSPISISNIRNGKHYYCYHLLFSTRCSCHHHFKCPQIQSLLAGCFRQQSEEGRARGLSLPSPHLGKLHTQTFRKWYRLLVVCQDTATK